MTFDSEMSAKQTPARAHLLGGGGRRISCRDTPQVSLRSGLPIMVRGLRVRQMTKGLLGGRHETKVLLVAAMRPRPRPAVW